jgi:predicted ATP-dependent protease
MAKQFHQGLQQSVAQFHGTQIGAPALSSRRMSAEELHFAITGDEISALDDGRAEFEVIGQPRALRALHMAVRMPGKGYNVFVTGMPGTGKRTAVMKVLEHYRGDLSRLRDIALVYNFRTPDKPKPLYFKPGEAVAFRKSLATLVSNMSERVHRLAEDHGFKERRDDIVLNAEGSENEALRSLEQKLHQDGFQMIQVNEENDQRTDIAPVLFGEAVSFEDLQRYVSAGEIDEQEWRTIREKYYRYMDEMNQIFQRLRSERSEAEQDLKKLRRESVQPYIQEEIAQLQQRFPDDRVAAYLDELGRDIAEHLEWFEPALEDREAERERQNNLERYDINILVDHSDTERAPLVFESHPDYQKLFGCQEYSYESGGEPRSSFHMLHAGSVLQAAGGYLVLRAEDILTQEESWNALKRAIQDGITEIRNTPGPFTPHAGGLKPEPIEVNLKVIILGSEHLYELLYNSDEEFGKLFKVPAEFDSVMPRTDETTRQYLGFMRMIGREESLFPMSYDGMAALLEYTVRLSEFREKLSTRFSQIADVIREAHYWAGELGRSEIDRSAVQRALDERAYLYSMPEEKIDEQIRTGELLIDVHERAVGRINGLAIVDRGFYAFARPILITARAAPGDKGIINIERESGLSGEIHDKGIYILEGFLQSRYARSFPLSLYASICFEQSYIEIDGDSASSPEVYVLLSAIADIELRQDIAVTGSVNQMGEIQPVGGISEKVEGFFEVCKNSGLTGAQGIIIPERNRENLILSRELQQAVAENRFHIYAVDTVDEAMEILTGMEAGDRTQKGSYKAGTINALVEKRLREMAQQMKNSGSS